LDDQRRTAVDGLFKEIDRLQLEVDKLTWPEDRPQIFFESWGEIPHDLPHARFFEVSEYRKEREYFERGIYLLNRGGDAHEVDVVPIDLTAGVKTNSSFVARVDRDSTGFAIIRIDVQNSVRFMDVPEVWDLPKVMSIIEDRLNASRVEQSALTAEVGARYRDSNGAWYLSWCTMRYRKDLNRILFGPTQQRGYGSKKPEIPDS
jgi:hypothetical protein